MKILMALILLISFTFPSGLAQAETREEKLALEKQLKIWSFNAVADLITYDYENFDSKLDSHKKYFTQKGCKKFLHTVHIFGLSEDFLHKKGSLKAVDSYKYLSRFSHVDNVDVSEIEKDIEKRRLKKKYGASFRGWHVIVPLIIEKKTGIIERQYKFPA